MTKQTSKGSIPYIITGTGHDQNLRFYIGYDEHFLFNKVASFLYILDKAQRYADCHQEQL